MSLTSGITKLSNAYDSYSGIKIELVNMNTLSTSNNDMFKIDQKMVRILNEVGSAMSIINRNRSIAVNYKPDWFINNDL